MARSVRRSVGHYVLGWVATGLAVVGGSLLTYRPSPTQLIDGGPGPAAAVLFLVLVALGEAAELRLVRGRSVKAFTLVEAAIVPTLLLFPPGWALLMILGGVAAGQLARRRPSFQLAFNLGQFGAAAGAAVTVAAMLRDGSPPLALRSIGAVALAVAAFGLINVIAVTGVVSRLERRPVADLLREETRLSALNIASNASLGFLVALVWVHEPQLLPLVAAPAFAVHLAYRGLLRSDQLLTEVRAQNIRLDRVVQGATDGIVLLDAAGTVEIWNPSIAALTGVDADRAVGAPLREVLDVVHPDGAPADPLAPLGDARPDDPVGTQELVLVAPGAGGHRVLITHGILFDDHGRVVGDVVLLRDVTREREVEHLKDDFVARVTHELRTPLTPIRGFAESVLAHDEELDPASRREMLSRILERADHMIGLVDDLLMVPQLSGTSARSDLGILSPGQLLAVVERAVEDLPGDVPVEVSGAVDLPDVVADRRWVGLIADRLLSNAAKFAPVGSPVEVRVRPTEDGEHVDVSVVDRGRGIPPDQQERIFDRFHRTEEPLTMETGGLGIGLYVARRLARRMGGDLRVDSQVGRGSTFTLTLVAAFRLGAPVTRSSTGTPTAAGRPGPAGPQPDRRSGSDPAP